MSVNSANRSFLMLLGIALAPYLLLGLFGCGLLAVTGYQVATGGVDGWGEGFLTVAVAVFLAATVAGSVLGLHSFVRQRRATRALVDFVAAHRLPSHDSVATVASGKRITVDVVDAAEPFSFTYGLLAPRVVVSRGLIAVVDASELEAVLTHERYHVRNYDPLKVLVARVVPSAFFFLPVLSSLRARYLAGRELAADRSALRACGRSPVANALYKVVAGPSHTTLGAAAAIGGSELLDMRVAQLEQGREPDPPAISRISITATALGLTLMTAGLLATIVALFGADGMAADSADIGAGDVLGAIACGVWPVLGGLFVFRWLTRERR